MAESGTIANIDGGADGKRAPYELNALNLQKMIEMALDSRKKTTVDQEVMPYVNEMFGGFHSMCEKLSTDVENGIDSKLQTVEQRRELYGPNSLPDPPTISLFTRMWEAAQDPTVIILAISASLSLALGLGVERCFATGWVEGCVILVAIVVVIMVSSVNDWQKDRQFRALNAVKDNVEINVIRDGKQVRVSTHDIVVGDVVELSVGDMLCADGIYIKGHGIKISESAMTGETDDMKKGDYVFNEDSGDMKVCPFFFGGTMVMEGTGRMVVVAVGVRSYIGATRTKMQEASHDRSVLAAKLDALAEAIGKIALLVGILVFLVLCLRMAIKFGKKDVGYTSWDHTVHWKEILGFLITAVTVLVVAVPEGLPLAVVIALAFSVKKMLKDQNLVRHLSACETMGGATTICSDKTGTLTMNRMTVMKAWSSEKIVNGDGEGLENHVKDAIAEAIALNSSARLEFPPVGPPEHIGNKTECGLLQFCHMMKKSYDEIRAKHKHVDPRIFAFSSKRKRMSTLYDMGDGTCRLYTKGAPEALLEVCTHVLDEKGVPSPLSAALKNRLITEVIDSFAQESLRTLCIASGTFQKSELPDSEDAELYEKNLCCLCIVGIEDPVRPEVPAALLDCRRAGITVRMVTGDNITTARAIAGKCGIAAQMDDYLAIEGADFRKRVLDSKGNMIQAEIDKIWPRLLVMARSSPLDKHTLVSGIMASTATPVSQVVAVTGDGTNDGPALKKADVGFAMGITGTSVAKDAADIILMDDNFTSIVKAVKWGRCVYDNICKFLQFQLTVNIAAVVVAFLGSCVLSESPLRAIHLLWINLIMDSLASLALATETPTDALLNRKPYGRTKPLLSPVMLRNMVFHSVYQIIIICILVWGMDHWLGILSGRPEDVEARNAASADHCVNNPTEHYTMVFNAFVLMQLFNEINCRRINNEANVFENIFSSPYFAGVVGTTIILQVILVEFGDVAFSTTALDGKEWAITIAMGVFELVWYQIIRFFPTGMFNRLSEMLVVEPNEVAPEEEEEGVEMKAAGAAGGPNGETTAVDGGAGITSGNSPREANNNVAAGAGPSYSTSPVSS